MPFYNAIMTAKTVLGKAGRLVIPKPLRGELQISPGDSLDLESSGGSITLRPSRERPAMRKKHGLWVLSAGGRVTTEDVQKVLDQVRQEREEDVLGKRR
jgi:AbrB family looped-hinge helix DNA binding protein